MRGPGFSACDTAWDDLRVSVFEATRLGFTDPDWVQFTDDGAASVGVYALAFNGAARIEEVFFPLQMPHAWKEGTTIYPHVHWAPSTADEGNIVWQMEYTVPTVVNAVFPTTTTMVFSDAAAGATNTHQIATNATGITMSGKTVSCVSLCRLFRDPAHGGDTYAKDAFLLYVDFHYEVDSVGSRQEYVK